MPHITPGQAPPQPAPPRTFLAETHSTMRVTPSMVRVRLGGEELSEFVGTGVPDERLRLLFPGDAIRSYTVRRFDPSGPYLDIDFVVHDGGVAATWALGALPGDSIRVSEARGWYRPPPDTDWQLLVADMTGLPALTRIVEQLPPGANAHVIASVPGPDDEQHFSTIGNVTYQWIHSSDADLHPAVASFPLPVGVGYLWSATEASDSRAIRRHFHRELGWRPERFEIKGYWRRDKEAWQKRYALVQDDIDAVRERALANGLSGHDLTQAVEAALENAGL